MSAKSFDTETIRLGCSSKGYRYAQFSGFDWKKDCEKNPQKANYPEHTKETKKNFQEIILMTNFIKNK